jgi:pimeloyl-ACP methyl ester carboxylesterase
MPGNMWDDEPEPAPAAGRDLSLRLLNVAARPVEGEPDTFELALISTRGEIHGVFHPVEGGTGAVICVGGALGGIDGPARKLYQRLPGLLRPHGLSVLRLDYRRPNEFDECVLEALAGCSFLLGIGASDLAIVGHSFGGAVAIRAGGLSPAIRGVVALSSQTYGTQEVADLGKPLLLVHGTGDAILSYAASEDIYARARDPKQIVLLEEDDHGFSRAPTLVGELVAGWLAARLAGEPMVPGREEIRAESQA